MVSVTEATEIILSNGYQPAIKKVALQHAVGCVLAEPIVADRDFPPFDRVAMDGIAIAYSAWKKGQREFLVEGIQAAGEPQKKLANATACLEVMTGAMVPLGTDTVIRYEDVDVKENKALIRVDDVQEKQNVHQQAHDVQKGIVLLEPNQVLSPAEIALLASVGKSYVNVFGFPGVAIVATGDELVDVDETPLPHQIRRSNNYALAAALKAMGCESTSFHLKDEKEILRKDLGKIINDHDVVVLSGGVSKGKFDFIPEVLEAIGVKKLFHHVSQRPGKPFWFGVSEKEKKAVFALPGNPVSTYMCFYRYVKPWIMKSMGVKENNVTAILARDFIFKPTLTYFVQVRIQFEEGKLMAYPDAGGGSGDFANLKNTDGFLELPLERSEFKAGEVFPFIAFRR